MTNTAITDPEIIERRYPVRVREFSLRRSSGGTGKWQGGDGLVREFEFLQPLTVSLLTQHRTTEPFGMSGGGAGQSGRQILIKADGSTTPLPSSATLRVQASERLRLETPGGGGWG
jgi:5-oxoprolinase (ATP-hydrolysing)